MFVTVLAALGLMATQQPDSEGKEHPEAEIVCKVTHIVGSKIPERVCRTKARWAEIELDMRESRRSTRQGASRCADSGRC